MIGDAFLLDAADPTVAARHFRDHWLPRLDELDERAIASAERSLDRAAYITEQAARQLRSHLRGLCTLCRAAPMASGSDICDACIAEADELADEERARERDRDAATTVAEA